VQSHFPALIKLRDEGKYSATLQFQLNKPLLTTLAHLVEADVLVMAKVRPRPRPTWTVGAYA